MIDNLAQELKTHLIQQLGLEDITADDIDTDKPLFDSTGLGLDSIDALELIVMLEQHYAVEVTNPEDSRRVFYSIATMADYIRQQSSNADEAGE